jgi:SHS2 domain-containing protein
VGQAGEATGEVSRWEHFEHAADVGVRGYGRTGTYTQLSVRHGAVGGWVAQCILDV